MRAVNTMGEGFRFRPSEFFFFFFFPVYRRHLVFYFCALFAFITWPHFQIRQFVFTFFFPLIAHFSQEIYAHVLFIIPRAALISKILFLVFEQNGMKTRLNVCCLPSKLNNLEKITGGYLRVVATK